MEMFRRSSNYTIPVYFKDQVNDIKNIEAEANQALKQIRSIYQEVMHPESHDEYSLECDAESSTKTTPVKDIKQCTIGLKNVRTNTEITYDSRPILPHCSLCERQFFNNVDHTTNNRNPPPEEKLNNETQCFKVNDYIVTSPNDSKPEFKITVPQPFSLSGYDKWRAEAKQLKLDKLKKEIDLKIDKELNVKVTCKPVPKHTNLPLYTEMVKKTEKRKAERKSKCMEVFGKNSKSLEKDKPTQKNLESTDVSDIISKNLQPQFKAKPIPKDLLSDKVNERIRNKEEIRKMMMAHRAEEMLMQSSSPISKKYITRSYSMLNLYDHKKESNTCKSAKPNISTITNRLYTKKCKETIEDWDHKVMRYCHKENETKTHLTINKSKPQPEQLLPFLYYPVRMSTAASLRDKQIRSEILAREKREQENHNNKESNVTQQVMQEEVSKKLQKLIPSINFEKEIEEKVRSFRESQHNRKMEYEQELDEIIKRVSRQCLLIERQTQKNKASSFKREETDENRTATVQLSRSNDNSSSAQLEEAEYSSEPEQSEEFEYHSEPEESYD